MSDNQSGVEIELIDVTKKYAGQAKPAVDSLSLTIPAGEIVMFIGPSGCGKTTSLKMINRLIEPSSGTIRINGKDINDSDPDELRRNIGYVIQGGSLFPHLTVAQNVGMVPGLLKWDKQRTRNRVDELLDMVGLDPARYRDRFPRELSGGQQQRVGVARGLAADPPVVLMDEPFGAVDPITRARLQDELMSIQEELRKTIVCVTHDIDEAVKLGDRILLLREGAHIAQYDTPEVLLGAPADDYVADFVGSGSTLKQLSLQRVSEIELSHPTTARVGSRVKDAIKTAERNGDEAVIVLDERNRPKGWVWTRNLRGELIEGHQHPAFSTVDHRSTLADALDTMLASGHGGAVVTGVRDEYQGVVSFRAITERIREIDQAAAERQRQDPKQPVEAGER
ncbi:ABC transporter [Enemella dayhoffiae]|uniref:ABC-type quaternary amine transporter n=1 Tax=Enemella dayhoffiae TaxID=2016507 RepID=A0A255H5Z7_9ACTN|nr:ABC transporter ATP-binding protein [Enemella dayhoffiae]OYO23140.1 ABC transporter [Enemella dayhoffiae]